MKKGMYALAGLIALALGFALPKSQTDAAELRPVQLIVVDAQGGKVRVMTDGGEAAEGKDLAAAIAELRARCAGTLFTQTAEHVVLSERAWYLMPQVCVCPDLRPAAKLYRAQLSALSEPGALLSFLQAHGGELTLTRARAALLENKAVLPPEIVWSEGGYLLA